jgi:hypothetical protein
LMTPDITGVTPFASPTPLSSPFLSIYCVVKAST